MKQFYKPLLCVVLLMVSYGVNNTFAQTTAVTSFTRISNSPTTANTVSYEITFSGAVSDISTSSFSLTATGSIVGASISAVAEINANAYRVYINTGVGSGTIALKFTGMGVSPSISTPLPSDGGTYIIDRTGPTVTSVTSSTANGAYKINNVISIQVNFSENVTVTSTPQLTLETGTTDRIIDYVGGNGTSTLTFSYTVQSGDVTSDLDYASTFALALNGGTIKDDVGNNAILTLASPGAAGSLGANKDIVIDTQGPTLIISSDLSFLRAGDAATITFTFSEAPIGFIAQSITVSNGSLGSLTPTGSPLVYTATFTPAANVSSGTVSIAVSAGSYIDAAGNNGGAGVLSPTVEIDTKTPTLVISRNTSSLKVGETATITFTFSEEVVGFTSADISFTNGTIDDFTKLSATVYTVTFTPTTGLANATAGISVSVGSYTDVVGNIGSGDSLSNIQIDTLVPTVTITSSVGAQGSTTTVDPIPFTITFSENVSGFIGTDVSIINGTLDGFSGSGTTYSITVVPTAKGDVKVSVAANAVYDDLGNDNLASNEYVINYDGVLPVELANYTAKVEGNYAKLIWQTTSEQNNKLFEIYRSGDDKQFVKIGTLAAADQSLQSVTQNYSFNDKKPLNGNNYYRLVQVDQDGKANELGERVVNFQFSTFRLQVYPNPTQEQVTVHFQAGRYSNLILSDMNGKVLQAYKLPPTTETSQLDLTRYAAGLYFVKLKGDQIEEVQKLIKQ